MANLLRTEPAVVGAADDTLISVERLRTNNQCCEKTNLADGKNGKPITMDYLMQVMMLQFEKTRQLIDTVRGEISAVYEKIDAVIAEVRSDIESIKAEYTAKLQLHDATLNSFDEKVISLSHKIGTLTNRNQLAISGIPSKPNENLSQIVKEIGRHLDLEDKTTEMTEIRRLRPEGIIVVEFAMKTSRNAFYSAYLHKRDLKLKHVGLDSDKRIYINENLTIEARKLKSAALHLKKAGKLASVYTVEGVVHVKPKAGGLSIAVLTEDGLSKYS